MAFFNKSFHPPGTAPGTLTPVDARVTQSTRFHLTSFDRTGITRLDLDSVDDPDWHKNLNADHVSWLHVQGDPDPGLLKALGEIFKLHPLALEDVQNHGQRPKIEPFEDQLFIVTSLPELNEGLVEIQQVSLFLGENFVISFCQGNQSHFDPIFRRLNDKSSQLRTHGADFLLYALLDVVIDQGFPVLEGFGLQIEEMEERILLHADKHSLEQIHTIKRELILLRRMLWPQREVINQLLRGEHALIKPGTIVYLRDCYDHVIQVMDFIETYRDMTSSMLDIYLSTVSNRMNDIMRVLTVISTIFIPLTFIVGVYGMNFDRSAGRFNMPELASPYGYLVVWSVMVIIALQMVWFFRRKKWL